MIGFAHTRNEVGCDIDKGTCPSRRRVRRLLLSAIPAMFFVSLSGIAGESAAPSGTLESYLAYAAANSPDLAASLEAEQAGRHRIAPAGRLPDPTLSYGYFVRSVETRVGPQRNRLSVKQSFPWPTKLTAGARQAEAKADAMAKTTDARAVSLRAAVAEKYWSLWSLQERRRIHVTHLEVLRGLSDSATAMLESGRIALADQQQIALTTARLEDLIAGLDAKSVQTAADLKGLIGAPQSMETPVTQRPDLDLPPLDVESMTAEIRKHPSILMLEKLEDSAKEGERRETASRLPAFSITADWIQTGKASMPDVQDSGKDAVVLGISVDLPLWQRNYKEGVEGFRAESRQYRAAKQSETERFEAALRRTLSMMNDAKRRATLYETTLLPQAESVLDSVLGAYMAGKSGIAAVLLAQKDLLDMRVELLEVKADFEKSRSMLDGILGRGMALGRAAGKGGSP